MKISKNEARDQLWRRGNLSWILDDNQKALYKLFHDAKFKVQTWLLARRSGKTFALCVLAIETCLKKPNAIVKFVAPTKMQITNILRPLMKKILETCPKDIQPEFKKQEVIYYFPNGSEIQLAGSEADHIEKLRGGDADICIVDEAGDVNNLRYAIQSVLIPTTAITKGKILISGTPPKIPDHEFIYFIEKAEQEGSLVKRTIHDNPRISKDDIEELIKELGGLESSATRRELFCEIIKDEALSVIPEFTPQLEKEITREWPRPPYFDAYEAMDLGMVDFTAVLFGYYDFRADKIIIEDEYCVRADKFLIPKLVENIVEKEKFLWFNPMSNEVKKPYLRVSDNNLIALSAISTESKGQVNFIQARKDDNETALNNLRVLIANKKIIIHPRCVNLLRHLRNVKWMSQTNKTKFARSPDDGHYDFVDTLKYFVRHVDYRRNPYPHGYELNLRGEDAFYNYNKKDKEVPYASVLKKMFNVKTKRY